MKSVFLILICLAFIQKCDPFVVFDSPQPVNKGIKDEFNEKFQGKYINEDSTFLIISKKTIIKKSQESFEILEDELDTMTLYTYDENYIYGPILDTARIVEKRNDTIMGEYILKDTLFNISDKHVLKKFKGNYYMNLQQRDNNWEVVQLVLRSDSLFINSIDKEKEIDLLKSITTVQEIKNDSTGKVERYVVKASQNEFKQIMKNESFTDIDGWLRVK